MVIVLLKETIILCLAYMLLIEAQECSKKCVCKKSNQGNGPDWFKVRCGDKEKVNNLDEVNLSNFYNEVVQLNLSNNFLSVFIPQVQLISLQKLDISKNQITALVENQFIKVPNLRKLDVSENRIKYINIHAFAGLKHLERLKMNNNQIVTIVEGTFLPLKHLKQLDISINPLNCNCDLLWILDWVEDLSVKLLSNSRCSAPPILDGRLLRKLRMGIDVNCITSSSNRDIPAVELSPNYSQIVFEGDSLKLNCRASIISNNYESEDQIEWLWANLDPKHYFENISIERDYFNDNGFLHSSLSINKLNRNHTGIWDCHLFSPKYNQSKGISIVVISNETIYCPIVTITNNKGSYTWPRTIINHTVTLPCEFIQPNNDISKQKASYFCSEDGIWKNLDTDECSYISETTKILEQFSKVNLSLAKGSILESAKHFKTYLGDLKILKDTMDLVFVIRTIQNYLTFVPLEKELGATLMDVSNSLLNLPESFIMDANLEDGSCNKFVKSLERIGNFTPSPLTHKSNIALEIFPVKQETFTGMTCTWYVNPMNKSDRMFYCVTTNHSGVSSSQEKIIEASIQIPQSLFYHLREQDMLFESTSHDIYVAMFSNSKLFPLKNKNERVISDVVGIKLDGFTIKNLTEPIYIMLRTPVPYSYETSQPVPVWWDPTLNNGTGDWSGDGCVFNTELQDGLVFHCKQLGYYGLRRDITDLNYAISVAKFRFSHPAVYIGSFMLFLCLFLCILTYLLCSAGIQMPKKAKHSLLNTWIAIVLLTFFYVFGIYQTEDVKLCEAIGLILHYLTLSSLLWMCVGINSTYKRLRKSDRIELQDDELPSDEPIQKPILGLYFVGWGVALIVCGISAAVNMKEYSSSTHCFLSSEPALSAVYVPFTILVVILCVFFLLVRCAMYSIDTGGHLSECTQATENVDIDLLEPSFPHVELRSVRSVSSKTGSSEMEDPEHSPIVQLKASVIFLALYVTTWLSCAIATVQPKKLQSYEDIFCIAYAGFATILGAFTIFFYCIARNDVRTCWIDFHQSFKRKSLCFRSRNISDATQNVPQIQIQPLPPIPTEEIHITSRSSSRSSHTKSNSHNSNILKGAADLNHPSFESPGGVKINNVNLVVLHRQQYRNPVVPNLIENPTNSAEMFYNPHQSTVARKFFRKQKQSLMKRNNLQTKRAEHSDNTSVASVPKQIKDNSSIDQSIFGTNTKVNNTNIHVEKIRKTKHKNPNILLDSCEDVEQNCEKTYKDKKRRDMNRQRHKKRQNVASTKSSIRENNMRSVSQQCTLEYSSETISDSILDQKSPEKSIQEVFRRDSSPSRIVDTENAHYSRIDAPFKNKRLDRLLDTLYEPSEASFSIIDSQSEFNEALPRIFVNPSHDLAFSKRVQSRASSVSASEIDELYQEIRRAR
ncbi:hypothetical protein AMK59_5731 [Oryctes borbonicus]|uniref:Adhesion G protein-coupled receptor A3 n=1 Tax=Oryctes borbonicus TaxID=1629725 RepID=A0A0T6B3J2_9SCAR|nr:hypothetical protein AMK59_5731 [Oryctes borbonicus]